MSQPMTPSDSALLWWRISLALIAGCSAPMHTQAKNPESRTELGGACDCDAGTQRPKVAIVPPRSISLARLTPVDDGGSYDALVARRVDRSDDAGSVGMGNGDPQPIVPDAGTRDAGHPDAGRDAGNCFCSSTTPSGVVYYRCTAGVCLPYKG